MSDQQNNKNDDENNNNNTSSTVAAIPEEKIPEGAEVFEIHEVDWEALRLAGWSENAIKKSVACGCIDENTCLKWLFMHVDHPDLNKPLEGNVHVKIKEKFKLTPEQRAAKVEELKARIKAKRDAEEQSKLHSEKDRIEDGKKALEAAEIRKQYKREQEERERRREKEIDRIAREKVLFELEVDRLKRTGLTEEEAKEKALAQQEEKRAAAKKRTEEQAAEARKRQEELERQQKESGSASSESGGAGAKKPWNLAAVLPHVASDPVPNNNSNNNNAASSSSGNNNNSTTSAAAAVMNMFASSANFYPKEMEDYTPFPEFVPSKKFFKNPPPQQSISTSTDEDPQNVSYVIDFSETSPKDVFKTLLVMVKEQCEGQQQDFKAVFSTLRRILSAIRDNLSEPKIRSLKPTGGLFRSHLSAFPNTLLFLRAVGFQKHTPPPPPKDSNNNNNDDNSNNNQPPPPAFELKYCDVALLFAALAGLDDVEAGNV